MTQHDPWSLLMFWPFLRFKNYILKLLKLMKVILSLTLFFILTLWHDVA